MSTAVQTKTAQELASELHSSELCNRQLVKENAELNRQIGAMRHTLRDRFAAKAAGIVIEDWTHESNPMYRNAKGHWGVWRPVTDKSDSFDLMVACGIELAFGHEGEVQAFGANNRYYVYVKIADHNNDKGLETMAAVFLCAVEIGKSLANGRAM